MISCVRRVKHTFGKARSAHARWTELFAFVWAETWIRRCWVAGGDRTGQGREGERDKSVRSFQGVFAVDTANAEFNKGRGCVKRYRMAAVIEEHVTQSPCAQNVRKGALWLNVLFSKNSFISGQSHLYIVPEYYVFLCHKLTFIQFTLFFDWFMVSNCLTSA